MKTMAIFIALSILVLGACAAHTSRLTETVLDLPVGNAGLNAGQTKPLYMSGYFKVLSSSHHTSLEHCLAVPSN